jgi:hypothetical protein
MLRCRGGVKSKQFTVNSIKFGFYPYPCIPSRISPSPFHSSPIKGEVIKKRGEKGHIYYEPERTKRQGVNDALEEGRMDKNPLNPPLRKGGGLSG